MLLRTEAYAKLNLTLDVLGLRPDGYHEMQMLMQTVSLCDSVMVETGTGTPWSLHCDAGGPSGPENLAWRAAEAFYAAAGVQDDGLRISIRKRIPAQAGLAGGSSDAAAVLCLLNACHGAPLSYAALCEAGARVGSDVPFCIAGGTALATGRGEQLQSLPPLPDCRFVLCRPAFPVSTPAMFRALDAAGISVRPDTAAALAALRAGSLPALGARLCNVFAPLVLDHHPQAAGICDSLRAAGALGCCMTGTGSVFYGLFDGAAAAEAAAAALRMQFPDVWICTPVAGSRP